MTDAPLASASVAPVAAPTATPVGSADGDKITDALARPADYLVLRQPVVEFLQVLARDQGLRLDMTERVRGTIVDMRLSGSVGDLLDQLVEAHALDWFAFNGVIHVSTGGEAVTRLIRLGDLDADHAVAVLDDAGLALARYPIRSTAERSTVAISGPPRMLALAEAVIESVPKRNSAQPKQRTKQRSVTVRRGVDVEQTDVPTAD